MKHIDLVAMIRVLPFEVERPPETEGGRPVIDEGKELVFLDQEGGEITHYKMGKDMAENVMRKLKMSNKSLAAQLEEEQRQVMAKAALGGGPMDPNGQALAPHEAKAVQNILRGIHTRPE